jgi:hemin uptake protein HemP
MSGAAEPDGAPPAALPGAAPQPARHDARELTGGGREAYILLDGAVYTLRITRQGKLILTK